MEILYISTVCSQKKYNHLFKLTNGKMHSSIQKFHSSIITGLKENDTNITALSGYQIARKSNKKIFFKNQVEIENGIKYLYPFLINIKILKYLTTIISFIIYLFNWIFINIKKEKVIFIDAAYVSISPIILLIAKLFNIKILGIVADIYDYMSLDIQKEKKRGLIKKIYTKFNSIIINNFDYYVLLTEKMNEIVNKKKKPYIVMEGILDYKDLKIKTKSKKKIILYSGGINLEYGLDNLIKAFHRLEGNIELHLYGNTNMQEFLDKYTSIDTRIKYFGNISLKEIAKKQSKAYILVNPRPTNEEYTKYSFPSKTLEYMATGNITVSTKLEGIPNEYINYLNYFEDETEEDIYQKLKEIIEDDTKYLKKAKEAKTFVLENKNKKVQTKRILNMLNISKDFNISYFIRLISLFILSYISIVPFASNRYVYLLSIFLIIITSFIINFTKTLEFLKKYKYLMFLSFIWLFHYLINYITGRADLILIHIFTYIRILSIMFLGLYLVELKDKFLNKILITFISLIIILFNIKTILANLDYYNLSRLLSTGINLDINAYGIASYSYIYGILYLILLLIIKFFKNIKNNFRLNLCLILLITSICLLIIAEFMISIILLILGLIIYYFKVDNFKKFIGLLSILILSMIIFSKPLSLGFKFLANHIDNYNIQVRLDDISKMLTGDIENTIDLKERLNVYSESITTFIKHPLFGIGFKGKETKAIGIGGHSAILDEFAKFGLMGGSILILLFISCFKSFLSLFTKKSKKIYFICSLIYILFMFINTALFVTTIYFIWLIIPLFILNFKEEFES